MKTTSLTRPAVLRLGVLLAAGTFALAGCASSAASTDAGSTPAATAAPAVQGGGGGISGEIAAVSGSTLQVQDSDSQTAVTYTDGTTITQTLAAALADVTAGVCVSTTSFSGMPSGGGPGGADDATGDGDDADAGGTDADASADSDDADAATAATTVTITAAVDGTCESAGLGGFGGGTPPEGMELPDGATAPTDGVTPPTDVALPEGADDADGTAGGAEGGTDGAGGFPGGAGGGGLTSGLVTAVSATSITVDATSADGTTTSTEVPVDDATTYTRTTTADTSALVVGACVTARGDSDDSGAVTATTIAVSEAGDDGCSTGFGGAGGSGGPGAGGSGGPGQGGTPGQRPAAPSDDTSTTS